MEKDNATEQPTLTSKEAWDTYNDLQSRVRMAITEKMNSREEVLFADAFHTTIEKDNVIEGLESHAEQGVQVIIGDGLSEDRQRWSLYSFNFELSDLISILEQLED